MAARFGKTVHSAELKCSLVTGEFVRIVKVPGRSFVCQIVDVARYDELPQADREEWAGDNVKVFVQVQWASVIGDDDKLFPTSSMPLEQRGMCGGLAELILRNEYSWLPIESLVEVVVVWPMADAAKRELHLHGMRDVFVIGQEQQANGTLMVLDADSFATFPETHPIYSVDENGERITFESRTSKVWTARVLLMRHAVLELLGQTAPGCLNSVVFRGIDGQTWDIIARAFTHDSIERASPTSRIQRGYTADTERAAITRFERKYLFEGFKASTAVAFAWLSYFMGNYWGLYTSSVMQRQSAAFGEASHPYTDAEDVRAIVQLPVQTKDRAKADRDQLHAIAIQCGVLDQHAPKPRVKHPKNPCLTVKYDADARKLSIAICFKRGRYGAVKEAVKSTLPLHPVRALRLPKCKKPASKIKPSCTVIAYTPTKTEREFWAERDPDPGLERASRRARLR